MWDTSALAQTKVTHTNIIQRRVNRMGWVVAQLVECFPHLHEALGSIPSRASTRQGGTHL